MLINPKNEFQIEKIKSSRFGNYSNLVKEVKNFIELAIEKELKRIENQQIRTEALAMQKRGFTVNEIAHHFELSRGAMCNILYRDIKKK